MTWVSWGGCQAPHTPRAPRSPGHPVVLRDVSTMCAHPRSCIGHMRAEDKDARDRRWHGVRVVRGGGPLRGIAPRTSLPRRRIRSPCQSGGCSRCRPEVSGGAMLPGDEDAMTPAMASCLPQPVDGFCCHEPEGENSRRLMGAQEIRSASAGCHELTTHPTQKGIPSFVPLGKARKGAETPFLLPTTDPLSREVGTTSDTHTFA